MYPNLICELSRHKISIDTIAQVLGKSPTNVRLRLRGRATLSCQEACKIRDYINENYNTNFTIDYLFADKPLYICG